jgi:hypothetical protein
VDIGEVDGAVPGQQWVDEAAIGIRFYTPCRIVTTQPRNRSTNPPTLRRKRFNRDDQTDYRVPRFRDALDSCCRTRGEILRRRKKEKKHPLRGPSGCKGERLMGLDGPRGASPAGGPSSLSLFFSLLSFSISFYFLVFLIQIDLFCDFQT